MLRSDYEADDEGECESSNGSYHGAKRDFPLGGG